MTAAEIAMGLACGLAAIFVLECIRSRLRLAEKRRMIKRWRESQKEETR